MGGDDITTQILREIRDQIRDTNTRLDQTNTRLDQSFARQEQTNARFEVKFEQLATRMTESEIRTATAITGMAGTLGDIKQLLTDRLDLRDRVDHCEREIEGLKARFAR